MGPGPYDMPPHRPAVSDRIGVWCAAALLSGEVVGS